MMHSNRLPLMRRMRIKSVIVHDIKDIKRGSLVIMNTMNVSDIVTKLGPVSITQKNLIQQVYLDKKVQLRVGNKLINQNFIDERKELYSQIITELPTLKGIQEGRLSLGYNTLYPLNIANDIFIKNTGTIAKLKKPLLYWQHIKSFIDTDKFSSYKYKTMIINAAEFESNLTESIQNRSDVFNPIGYLYLLMKYNYEEFVKLGDFDIIITNKTDSLRINPTQCRMLSRGKGDKYNPAIDFRKELYKLLNKADPEQGTISNAERIYNSNVKAQTIADNIISYYAAGATGEVPDEAKEKINKAVEKIVDEKIKNDEDITQHNVEQELEKDVELLKQISQQNKPVAAKQSASSKRDEMLREKQAELEVRGKSIKELLETVTEDVKIEVNDISNSVETINKNVTDIRFPNINKAYIENVMEKDIINSIMCMNDKSIPVYIRSIKVEDTSDISNLKDTYTIELEDSLRVRHRLVFDVPKYVENRFLYLGGNRKYVNNQQMLLPIVKTAPDTVQLVSSYNKIYMKRYGNKVSATNEKLKKALGLPNCGARVIPGKFDTENKQYVTTIDYDDLSKLYKEIHVGDIKISFNQADIRKEILDAKIKNLEGKLDVDYLPIGVTRKGRAVFYCIDLHKNTVVEMNLDGSTIDTGKQLIEFILNKSSKLEELVGDQTAGKKYMYNRATIMKKEVPIILLLAYFDGLDAIMRRANVKHYFSDTRPRVDMDETVIEFADGYLVFSQKPYENTLLMNGLLDVPTKNYSYDTFNDQIALQSVFETMFGRRNIANAFGNFKDNFIDPMTLEILQRLSLPTDLTGMVLYGNNLLADNQYMPETDLRLYRTRSAEVISGIVYKQIAKAYEQYKDTAHFSNPKKISIPRNAIIKDVMKQQIIEDYSELNPVSELQKLHGCTKKGPSGCNLAEAYTEEQRSFHNSMTGVFTISSSPDANVGVQRVLTLEPPITDVRGLIDNKTMDGRIDEYKDVNLFGPAEMLNTTSARHDDSMRIAMATKQFTHLTPIAVSSPSLVTNGSEQSVQYHLSKDWVFVAQEDGKVVELDEANGLMIVEYKSGKTDAISIGTKIAKNGAGGFYLSKKLIPNLKVGQSFKKNDILAQDRDFFTNNQTFGNKFNVGSLQKVALLSSAMTFEDSSYITKKVSRDMASEIVMSKQAVLGPNTNVDYMVKIGDRVQTGDELIRFERSFDEDALNAFLFKVGQDMKEEITMSSKDRIKTKYTGIIEDIKIYSSVDLDELSPSLRKIVNGYYNQIKAKKKILDKYDTDGNDIIKCGMLFNEPTSKVEVNINGMFKGAKLNEGVLIEFYIRVHDELGVGDKLVFFSALKSIVGTVIPEGEEAYTLFRPEEKIGAVLSCNSLISRGVTSCPLMMVSNKLLIELSRQLKDIYDGK